MPKNTENPFPVIRDLDNRMWETELPIKKEPIRICAAMVEPYKIILHSTLNNHCAHTAAAQNFSPLNNSSIEDASLAS